MRSDGPSRTAQFIAISVVLAGSHPALRNVLPPAAGTETARYLRAVDGWTVTAMRLASLFPPSLKTTLIGEIPPQALAHPVLRKRWIEDHVRSLLGERSQVVVLGAGFDTLAPRLHEEYPNVHFWEVDHPATQRVKRRGVGASSNLTLLAADFAERSPMTVLTEQDTFDPDANTVVTAEGLLMYLAADEVEALLQGIHDHTGPESHLVGTAVDPRYPGASGSDPSANEVPGRWLKSAVPIVPEQ